MTDNRNSGNSQTVNAKIPFMYNMSRYIVHMTYMYVTQPAVPSTALKQEKDYIEGSE